MEIDDIDWQQGKVLSRTRPLSSLLVAERKYGDTGLKRREKEEGNQGRKPARGGAAGAVSGDPNHRWKISS